MTPEERCELINRVSTWVYDQSESFAVDNLGVGLAYLTWAIAGLHDAAPFDAGIDNVMYRRFIKVLKANTRVWDILIKEGFILT